MNQFSFMPLLLVTSAAFAEGLQPKFEIRHQSIQRRGWAIHADVRLLSAPHRDVGSRAIELLTGKLLEISVSLPTKRLLQLRRVPIFLDLDHPLKVSQYHADKKWLAERGYDVALAGGVHIPNAQRFVALVESDKQPWVVMHELAHAYHDQFLGFDEHRVLSNFRRLKKGERFESVPHASGKLMRHYAAKDHKEYFAEMTESYLGRNDFYPFTREDLRRFDGPTFRLLSQIWSNDNLGQSDTLD